MVSCLLECPYPRSDPFRGLVLGWGILDRLHYARTFPLSSSVSEDRSSIHTTRRDMRLSGDQRFLFEPHRAANCCNSDALETDNIASASRIEDMHCNGADSDTASSLRSDGVVTACSGTASDQKGGDSPRSRKDQIRPIADSAGWGDRPR